MICKSIYILKVYSISYTLRQNRNVKKFFFRQNKRYKNVPFFFVSSNMLQLITVLLLIGDFYIGSLNRCVGFSIFCSLSFLLKFRFLLNKKLNCLKMSWSFSKLRDWKIHTDTFTSRLLILRLQHEFLKFN